MSDPTRFSRWKRLPGVRRVQDARIPTHLNEDRRLSLYLKGEVLEHATQLAIRAGAASVQEYCEALLTRVLEAEFAGMHVVSSRSVEEALASYGAMLGDDDAEHDEVSEAEAPEMLEGIAKDSDGPFPIIAPHAEGATMDNPAISRLLHHAALGGEPDSTGFLGHLRRGEPAPSEVCDDLLGTLAALEGLYRGEPTMDRRVAYTLHRIAFEAQVLLSDAWPALAGDRSQSEAIYRIQQAVDRVLSGLDVHYLPSDGPNDGQEPIP